jgi:hypothetical protein
MTQRWRATMPKELPATDMSHFVLALKTDTGERVEFAGKAMTNDVLAALRTLQDAVKTAKETT